jgi:hypothetical protein
MPHEDANRPVILDRGSCDPEPSDSLAGNLHIYGRVAMAS